MKADVSWWNEKHHTYQKKDWINKPSLFAKFCLKYFPLEGRILELGAGHGQDSRFFAGKGYEVDSTDYSETAIKYNKEKTSKEFVDKINIRQMDMSEKFPFENETFDVVYANMSINYLDLETTQDLIKEIYRVLKPEGVVAVMVNPKTEDDYGKGLKLEEDYFELKPGKRKRFFDKESLGELMKNFETIILDSKGAAYKDPEPNLVRFIGKKI